MKKRDNSEKSRQILVKTEETGFYVKAWFCLFIYLIYLKVKYEDFNNVYIQSKTDVMFFYHLFLSCFFSNTFGKKCGFQ